MNNTILFSIAIPTYKGTYLKEALYSLLRQTYQKFEVIIVDDFSPEDIRSIVIPFLQDKRFSYYRNDKNIGAENVVDNWNKCLHHCKGDFVICMGDDDSLAPNCLECYAEAIKIYPDLDVFHGRVNQINEDGNILRILEERPELESPYELILGRIKGRRQYIGDFCYRTKRLKQEGGFYKLPFAWGSDDITSYICATPNGICNVNIPIFNYRIHGMTISNSGNERKKMEAALMLHDWLFDYVENQKAMNIDEKIGEIEHLLPYMLSKIQEYIILPTISNDISYLYKWYKIRKNYRISFITFIRIIYHTKMSNLIKFVK